VPVLLALVNVALYFQDRFDWRSYTTGSLEGAAANPTADASDPGADDD
jgi:ACR3 family arsenite transporter